MLLRSALNSIHVLATLMGPVALCMTLTTGAAIAEQSKHHEHHHHHKVHEDVKRTKASYSIPDVNLINQHGQKVLLKEILDTEQPVMLNFIFTSCTAICPTMTAIFASVQNKLGNRSKDLRMVSISIDPEYDTPEALNAYAKRFKAGPQWEFLTGSLSDCIAIQKAFDADRGNKMNHAPMTLLRASSASQWVRYEGFATASVLAEAINEMF